MAVARGKRDGERVDRVDRAIWQGVGQHPSQESVKHQHRIRLGQRVPRTHHARRNPEHIAAAQPSGNQIRLAVVKRRKHSRRNAVGRLLRSVVGSLIGCPHKPCGTDGLECLAGQAHAAAVCLGEPSCRFHAGKVCQFLGQLFTLLFRISNASSLGIASDFNGRGAGITHDGLEEKRAAVEISQLFVGNARQAEEDVVFHRAPVKEKWLQFTGFIWERADRASKRQRQDAAAIQPALAVPFIGVKIGASGDHQLASLNHKLSEQIHKRCRCSHASDHHHASILEQVFCDLVNPYMTHLHELSARIGS